MPAQPQYPIALIQDDGLAELHHTYESLARTVEPHDLMSVVLVDSSGQAFSLEPIADVSFLDKVLTALGTPRKYQVVPFSGVLSADVLANARAVFSSGANK